MTLRSDANLSWAGVLVGMLLLTPLQIDAMTMGESTCPVAGPRLSSLADLPEVDPVVRYLTLVEGLAEGEALVVGVGDLLGEGSAAETLGTQSATPVRRRHKIVKKPGK